jgi:hypothetical protein
MMVCSGRSWALAVLCIAILGVILATWMLVYVNLKLCDKTLSGTYRMLSFLLKQCCHHLANNIGAILAK